jgi:Uncharacterised ACR, YggU family COG1872
MVRPGVARGRAADALAEQAGLGKGTVFRQFGRGRSARPGDTGGVRVTIRVKPGSARAGVGGEPDGALVVRVRERAVDGKATAAALAAVAAALGSGPAR